MRSSERGFTLIELVVAVVIVGILVTLMMPSMLAAQTDRRLQAYANEAAAQLRDAKIEAMSQEQTVGWILQYDTNPDSWTFVLNPGASETVTTSVTLPPPFRITGACYRGHFTPQGVAATNCSNVGQFEWLCFDSDVANGPMILIEINTTTGQITEQTTSGVCKPLS